jgi:hypothetical protein
MGLQKRREMGYDMIELLLKTGVEEARKIGYINIGHSHIAKLVGRSHSIVTHHFGSNESFIEAVKNRGIEERIPEIMLHAMLLGDLKVDIKVQKRIFKLITEIKS